MTNAEGSQQNHSQMIILVMSTGESMNKHEGKYPFF